MGIVLQITSIALCSSSTGVRETAHDSRIDSGDHMLMEGCAYPISSNTYRTTAALRSSFVLSLSKTLSESLNDEEVLLLLERGGTLRMRGKNISVDTETRQNLNEKEIPLKLMRIRDKVNCAKKLIQEQELSSRLEHLSIRKKMPRESEE